MDNFFTKFVTSGIGARNTGLAGASTNHAGVDLLHRLGLIFMASLPGKVSKAKTARIPEHQGWFWVVCCNRAYRFHHSLWRSFLYPLCPLGTAYSTSRRYGFSKAKNWNLTKHRTQYGTTPSLRGFI